MNQSQNSISRKVFSRKLYEEVGRDRWHDTHASIIKCVNLIHHSCMKPKCLDKDWLMMEEERLFIAEKLAHGPRVVFMVFLFCPVSWWTTPDILQLAKEVAFNSIWPEWERFGFGNGLEVFWKYKCTYSIILCTGCTNYVNILITRCWSNFRWKLILRMKANSQTACEI